MMDMTIKLPSIWVSIPVSSLIDTGIDGEKSVFLGGRSPRKNATDG